MAGTPINKLPLGLLGFLGIKNGGQYPRELNTLLQGTWDLAGLYTAVNSEVANINNAAVNAIGFQAVYTVPNGEVWRVLDWSANTSTLGAGQTVALGLAISDPSTSITVAITSPTDPATTGGRAYVASGRPIYVGPGAFIGFIVSQLAAGPVTVGCAIRFARFQI